MGNLFFGFIFRRAVITIAVFSLLLAIPSKLRAEPLKVGVVLPYQPLEILEKIESVKYFKGEAGTARFVDESISKKRIQLSVLSLILQ